MEVAVRVLNLLLILVLVFQGLCAVPGIGKRQFFPWEIIPDIVPDIIPDIPKDPIPDIPGDPVPDIPGGPVPPGDGGPVILTLGKYSDNNQAPFSDLTGEWDPYFSRVDDILEAAAETDVNDNKPNETPGGPGGPKVGPPAGTPTIITYTITDFCSTPVAGGNCATIPTYITVFDPAQPTNACSAWSSLSSYCSGGGTNCACYSSSYYVPDQWNSLAAVCAKAVTGCPPTQTLPPVPVLPSPPLPRALSPALKARYPGPFWCDFARSAWSYALYCPTNTSTVAFAAVTPTPTTAAPTGSAATAIEVPRIKILTTVLFISILVFKYQYSNTHEY
ncbi:hypothetical protein NA56DRAFT_304199 [Hyaloscypha hepaticicola]|uniref:Extracellular membrane protein CFEM domain-containing protein n=1 Tax=Hyaloscypha hepaticicola TaxID=2082293 RepID=A0A2J6PS58_9HELO|nr:hypothetical protein NA56DRAFT_304199 [Hyaloscypha hepaticicola]